jgi:ubiquinone/menaquinone biosynthesis C-methylase UbiE
MLAVARRRNPGVALTVADVRRLPMASSTCAGAVAFYSIQYIPIVSMPAVLGELRRVLSRDGVLVLATHLGEGIFYGGTEWMGHQVERVGGVFYERGQLEALVDAAGFTVESSRERGPLPHEHQGQRVYVVVRVG